MLLSKEKFNVQVNTLNPLHWKLEKQKKKPNLSVVISWSFSPDFQLSCLPPKALKLCHSHQVHYYLHNPVRVTNVQIPWFSTGLNRSSRTTSDSLSTSPG